VFMSFELVGEIGEMDYVSSALKQTILQSP
jgi:hypothetical protein